MDADTPRRRRARCWGVHIRVVLSAACAAVVLAACSSAPAVRVPVPTSDGAGCARLHRVLPAEVGGGSSRDVKPASARTAAWGSPAVVLRCGVREPAGLACDSQTVEVDGVAWYLSEPYPPYVFTTVARRTYVQVRVPASVPQSEATGPLAALAPAVRRSDPVKERCATGSQG